MGIKTGKPRGRPRGVPNKATAERQEEVAASGVTPLEFMLKVMRDTEKSDDDRFEAAKAAAPYVHPRLAATQLTGELVVNDVSSDPEPTTDQWSAQHGHT